MWTRVQNTAAVLAASMGGYCDMGRLAVGVADGAGLAVRGATDGAGLAVARAKSRGWCGSSRARRRGAGDLEQVEAL